jgi:hypothetical protein
MYIKYKLLNLSYNSFSFKRERERNNNKKALVLLG